MPSRIDMLRGFIAQRPDDPFPRYALALEHKNAGQLDDAWRTFEELMNAHSEYVAAYLHAGATLIALGRRDDAKIVFARGIDMAMRKGDAHARGELDAALSQLG